MRTIYILWLRQLKRFIRKKAALIGALGQPVLFFLALGFGLSPIFARGGGLDYIQFLAPGIMVMTVLFTAMFTGMEVIWDKQFGFLKETLVAPVSRFEIMMGKTLGGATVAVIQGLLVFLITLLVGFRPVSWLMLPAALGFLSLIAILFSALGATIAARLDDMQGFPLIINFLIQPLFFLSGALFPLQDLPAILAVITKVNPLSYGVEGLRFALVGHSFLPPLTSLLVLLGASLAVTAAGIYQFSKVAV
ncbi:MAG: ABC transporter permease [Candidatus Vogelbacteria bacterium]|nr:ABC transporter permease [Candidatus Vogelbacteria bacterium]